MGNIKINTYCFRYYCENEVHRELRKEKRWQSWQGEEKARRKKKESKLCWSSNFCGKLPASRAECGAAEPPQKKIPPNFHSEHRSIPLSIHSSSPHVASDRNEDSSSRDLGPAILDLHPMQSVVYIRRLATPQAEEQSPRRSGAHAFRSIAYRISPFGLSAHSFV